MKKAEFYDAFYNGIEEDFNKIKLEIQEYSKKEILGDYQSWQKEFNKKGSSRVLVESNIGCII